MPHQQKSTEKPTQIEEPNQNDSRREFLTRSGLTAGSMFILGAALAYGQDKKEGQTQPNAQDPKQLKRLSKDALREEILEMERAKPIVLDEAQYKEWLEHTVLARFERGENMLAHVRGVLEKAASQQPAQVSKTELDLALGEIDNAIVAFQYGVLKFNIMYRPAIANQEVKAVILWNQPIGKTKS